MGRADQRHTPRKQRENRKDADTLDRPKVGKKALEKRQKRKAQQNRRRKRMINHEIYHKGKLMTRNQVSSNDWKGCARHQRRILRRASSKATDGDFSDMSKKYACRSNNPHVFDWQWTPDKSLLRKIQARARAIEAKGRNNGRDICVSIDYTELLNRGNVKLDLVEK